MLLLNVGIVMFWKIKETKRTAVRWYFYERLSPMAIYYYLNFSRRVKTIVWKHLVTLVLFDTHLYVILLLNRFVFAFNRFEWQKNKINNNNKTFTNTFYFIFLLFFLFFRPIFTRRTWWLCENCRLYCRFNPWFQCCCFQKCTNCTCSCSCCQTNCCSSHSQDHRTTSHTIRYVEYFFCFSSLFSQEILQTTTIISKPNKQNMYIIKERLRGYSF